MSGTLSPSGSGVTLVSAGSGAVSSVAGRTGDVTLATADVSGAATAASVTTEASARLLAEHPGYVSGRFYPTQAAAMTSAAVPAVDVVYLYIFRVHSTVTVAGLYARVNAGGAGSAIKSGIWANSASQRPTGVPLVSLNTGVATTAAATVTLDVADTVLVAGWYWMGSKFTGTLPTLSGTVPAQSDVVALIGAATNTAATLGSGMPMGVSAPDAYANDIAALNLTSATFTELANVCVPHLAFGVA